jgi:hypothetical protein
MPITRWWATPATRLYWQFTLISHDAEERWWFYSTLAAAMAANLEPGRARNAAGLPCSTTAPASITSSVWWFLATMGVSV